MNMSMDKITGLHVAPDEFDGIVKRLCFFAPSGSGAYLRELLEFLTLQSMATLPSKMLSAREIYQKLVKTIGQRFEYEEILDAIARLANGRSIHCDRERPHDPDAIFSLDIAVRTQMHDQVKGEAELEREVLEAWKASLNKKHPSLSNSDIDDLSRDLRIFALRLLSQHSAETLGLYYGNDSALAHLLSELETRNVAELWEPRDANFQALRLQEITGFFREADDRRKQFIASLMHGLFILQLTQLDPRCAAIVRSQLSPAKLYLDTNFVFRLVGLQGPDLYLAATKLAEVSQKLGYQLVISPQTLSEYNHTLAEFLRELSGRPMITSELANLALHSTSDEDFITAYWSHVRKSGSYVDPSTFYEYYQFLVPILKDRGVDVDDAFSDEVSSRDSDLAGEESLLRQVMQDRNMRSADSVSPYVLRHDVYHRLLVMRYRNGLDREVFADARAWFLTCDTKLAPYDWVARSKQGLERKLPFCVTSGQWIQTLRPFLGSNGELNTAQVDMLVSPLLRAYRRPPSRLIQSVIERLALSSGYSPSAVSVMLSNRQFLEQFEAAREDAVIQQDVIDNFFASYADEMEKKAKQLENQVAQSKAELEEASRKIAEESQKRSQTETRLESATREVASLEVNRQELNNSLQFHQQQAEQERFERQRIQQEKETQELKYKAELQNQRDEAQRRIQDLARRGAVALLILSTAVMYILIRQPWLTSPSPLLEVIGALALGLYISYVVLFGFWRTRAGVLVTIVCPVVFLISPFMPPDWMDKLQGASIILGGAAWLSLIVGKMKLKSLE